MKINLYILLDGLPNLWVFLLSSFLWDWKTRSSRSYYHFDLTKKHMHMSEIFGMCLEIAFNS